MKKLICLCLIGWLVACSPEPRPIEYGFDACEYCKMTIVDKQHAAEAVTSKGRVYKFDAIECLVPYVVQKKEEAFAFVLVTDYSAPGQWSDARESTFLISEALPSPMGAFLTAFKDKDQAMLMKKEKGGALFTWKSLKQHLQEEEMAGR